MTKRMAGTREEWLAARLELLKAEKELTRRGDELALKRQEVAWGRGDKTYRVQAHEGECLAIGPLSRALAAPRLPLHVRARLHRRLSVLLGHRGRLQRVRDSSSPP